MTSEQPRKRRRVLLIGLNPAMTRYLEERLARELRGWDISGHSDWAEARARAETSGHDVVVLDTEMETHEAAVHAFIERAMKMCPRAKIVVNTPVAPDKKRRSVHADVARQTHTERLAHTIKTALRPPMIA
jgi:DNA-binding NtrC family response regulator